MAHELIAYKKLGPMKTKNELLKLLRSQQMKRKQKGGFDAAILDLGIHTVKKR